MATVPTQKNPEGFRESRYRPEEKDVGMEGEFLSHLTSAAGRMGRWWSWGDSVPLGWTLRLYDVLSTSRLLHSCPASALVQANIISGGSRQKPPHQSPAPSVLPASCPPRCSQELHLHLKSDHVLLCSKPLLTAFQSHSSSSSACAIYNLAPGLSTFLPFSPSLAPLHRTSSLLLLGPISYALTSRPLHGLFHLPGMLFPPTTTWPTLFTSSLSLFKSRSSVRPLCPCFPSQSLSLAPLLGPQHESLSAILDHSLVYTRCLLSVPFRPYASTAGTYRHLLNEWWFLLGNN